MQEQYYLLLIPLLPLAVFVLLGLFGKTYFNRSAGLIATLALSATVVLALLAAFHYFTPVNQHDGAYKPLTVFKYVWLPFSETMSIDMGFLLDPISAMMLVVISVVSLMVHVFSLGYMKGEERYATYYAFLGLFTFSMLGLVVSSNIFQMYIFWELVGLSSFLLIGFYYDRPSAVAAAKKAFIVTRFADLGFLVGILILAFNAGTLDFGELIHRLSNPSSSWSMLIAGTSFMGLSALTWGAVLVFIGGAGKSAMFPLHIWLPDAMEGPTPVSALIHAATMVVAGVYLVARLFPVFYADGYALQVVSYVGAFSALIAAVMACAQTDIKRVLAYSTMSQIGYMMFALGAAGYTGEAYSGFTASMFHLFTHAFFKSLLFLCAGAIIHAVHSNEMNHMGGLRKKMPLVHYCFALACLAIAGIPPLSGFFSKEEILAAAWHSNKIIYATGLLVSGITAFYMFRLFYRVFWNEGTNQEQYETGTHTGHAEHAHLPWSMKIPLLVLAIAAATVGWIPFGKFVTVDGTPAELHIDGLFSLAPVGIALAGIGVATWFYKNKSDRPARLAHWFGSLYRGAKHRFYIDEVYLFITQKVMFQLIGRAAAWIDKNMVDGFMNAMATATAFVSVRIKKFQSGKVQAYALYFFGGILLLGILVVYVWKV